MTIRVTESETGRRIYEGPGNTVPGDVLRDGVIYGFWLSEDRPRCIGSGCLTESRGRCAACLERVPFFYVDGKRFVEEHGVPWGPEIENVFYVVDDRRFPLAPSVHRHDDGTYVQVVAGRLWVRFDPCEVEVV